MPYLDTEKNRTNTMVTSESDQDSPLQTKSKRHGSFNPTQWFRRSSSPRQQHPGGKQVPQILNNSQLLQTIKDGRSRKIRTPAGIGPVRASMGRICLMPMTPVSPLISLTQQTRPNRVLKSQNIQSRLKQKYNGSPSQQQQQAKLRVQWNDTAKLSDQDDQVRFAIDDQEEGGSCSLSKGTVGQIKIKLIGRHPDPAPLSPTNKSVISVEETMSATRRREKVKPSVPRFRPSTAERMAQINNLNHIVDHDAIRCFITELG